MGDHVVFVRNALHGLVDIVVGVAGQPVRFQIGSAVRLNAPVERQPARLAREFVLAVKHRILHVGGELESPRQGAVRGFGTDEDHAPPPVEATGVGCRRRDARGPEPTATREQRISCAASSVSHLLLGCVHDVKVSGASTTDGAGLRRALLSACMRIWIAFARLWRQQPAPAASDGIDRRGLPIAVCGRRPPPCTRHRARLFPIALFERHNATPIAPASCPCPARFSREPFRSSCPSFRHGARSPSLQPLTDEPVTLPLSLRDGRCATAIFPERSPYTASCSGPPRERSPRDRCAPKLPGP